MLAQRLDSRVLWSIHPFRTPYDGTKSGTGSTPGHRHSRSSSCGLPHDGSCGLCRYTDRPWFEHAGLVEADAWSSEAKTQRTVKHTSRKCSVDVARARDTSRDHIEYDVSPPVADRRLHSADAV